MNHLAIAPLLLPLLAGILLILAGKRSLAWQRPLSLAAVAVQGWFAWQLNHATGDGTILVYALGNWPPPFGIVLVVDRLAAWMLLITALLAIFVILHAMHGSDGAGRHFHALLQLQLFGLNGAFLTGDLFNLFVFFEVLLLASYGLLLHGGGPARIRAALHYVVINVAGSSLFLIAVGTLYGIYGTLNMADLALKVMATPPANIGLARAAGLLLFAVFALKAALLPLHLWLPPAYTHASGAVAALFAIMTKVGAYGILRVYSLIFGAEAGGAANLIAPWLLPLALATVAAGVAGAVAATSLRQQAAYLTAASVGTLLVAFGLGSGPGVAAGLYYLAHTTFASAAFFLLADLIAQRRSAADRFEPAPAMAQAPLLGALFFVGALLLAGLPPLSGFLGKFLILRAALPHPYLPWVMAVLLLSGLLALVALARSGSLLFYRALPQKEDLPTANKSVGGGTMPTIGLVLLAVAMTVFGGLLQERAMAAAEQVLQPRQYIRAILGEP